MPKRRVKRHSVVQPLDKSYRLIPLTQGQNAIVDAADFEWLSQWVWYAQWKRSTRSFYARRSGPRPKRGIKMHRVIMKFSEGKEVDHINHDTLDNRKNNLRICTREQNARNFKQDVRNSTGFWGVFEEKGRITWRATFKVKGKRIKLGNYATKEEAAHAYDAAARQHYGEFARVNFPI